MSIAWPGESRRRCAPSGLDSLVHSQYARRPAARQHQLPDVEIGDVGASCTPRAYSAIASDRPVCDARGMSAIAPIPTDLCATTNRRAANNRHSASSTIHEDRAQYKAAALTAAKGTSVILALNPYNCIGCSPGKHPDTGTMAPGSDDDSRESVHGRCLCISA